MTRLGKIAMNEPYRRGTERAEAMYRRRTAG